AVVVWIGGVWFVTAVALPALRRGDLGEGRLAAFHAIESRFVWHARTAVIVVGASGLYMVWRLGLWARFGHAAFWWMHAMVLVWLLFAIMLFIVEPFVLSRRFPAWAQRRPAAAFAWLHRAHWVLLALSLVTIFGAVAGSRGWSVFF
ncbi:MAG: hypothetical protein ACREEQ_11220, partial [Caulobacteraceae bacterium]